MIVISLTYLALTIVVYLCLRLAGELGHPSWARVAWWRDARLALLWLPALLARAGWWVLRVFGQLWVRYVAPGKRP